MGWGSRLRASSRLGRVVVFVEDGRRRSGQQLGGDGLGSGGGCSGEDEERGQQRVFGW